MPRAAASPSGVAIDGDKVKRLREKTGLSREGMAVKAGLSYTTIVRVEQGKIGDAPLSTIYLLAAALGVTTDALLRGK